MVGSIALVIGIFAGVFSLVPPLVWAERRVAGWIQNRMGPNRVGPFGLFQPVADVIKLLLKEDIIPQRADRLLYVLAPALVFIPAALSFAVIPVAPGVQIARLNVGVLFAVTISSFAVYGIVLGSWSSNSKWPLLGGLRASAQMVSYEVALALALVSAIMSLEVLETGRIVEVQAQGGLLGWTVFRQPLAFLLFAVAAFAETNRLPFDLPECESELVGGYHTEYSSMKFGMFFLGEYVAMITMSALIVTIFLGGWHPGFPVAWEGTASRLLGGAVFGGKLLLVLFFFVWVRWTLPRFRYDQLMSLGWKGLIPLSLGNIFVTGILRGVLFA